VRSKPRVGWELLEQPDHRIDVHLDGRPVRGLYDRDDIAEALAGIRRHPSYTPGHSVVYVDLSGYRSDLTRSR
jgi:hypothetical protein